MSKLKLTEKGEKWISELTERLSDGTEKLIILEPEQCKGLHLVLAAWNTRTDSPRFTAEEREAMEVLMKNTVGRGMDTRTYVALLTVRAMLTASEIADKGKGVGNDYKGT